MVEPALLELRNVSLDRPGGRGPVRAVDDLSITIEPGELVALMGPSGSGKTSVVELGCGVSSPSSGHVLVAGHHLSGGDRRRWAQLRRHTIGVIGQRLDLLEGLSVLDNVALPLLLERERPRRAHARAREALVLVGLEGVAESTPAELSLGEQQRVAVARATVGERRLVLADEPTAALDTVNAEAVVAILCERARSGVGVLMATHDTRLASWADRVIFLRDGRITSEATAGAAL